MQVPHPARPGPPEAETGWRVDELAQIAPGLDHATAQAGVEIQEWCGAFRLRGDARDLLHDAGSHLADRLLVQVSRGNVGQTDVSRLAQIVAGPREDSLGVELHLACLGVDQYLVQIGRGLPGQVAQEHIEQELFGAGKVPHGGPAQHQVPGLLIVLVRELDDANRCRVGHRRGRKPRLGVARPLLLLAMQPGQDPVHALEDIRQRHLLRVGSDHSHVGEMVRIGVELADVFGPHLADRGGPAPRVVGQGMVRSVQQVVDAAEHAAPGIVGKTDHLVVDRPLLFQAKGPVAVRGHAEVAHLAPNLLVGVVGVEQRMELALEHPEVDIGAGGRVRVIASSPLQCERGGLGQRHLLQTRHATAHVALAEQQVLLRVRFAHVRGGKGVDPQERLGHRFDL